MANKKWLKKYTSFKYLEGILRDTALYLADPEIWPDKNDLFAIDKSGLKNARVLCLTAGADRYHFWRSLGDYEEKVCLWFEQSTFSKDIKDLNSQLQLKEGYVRYPTMKIIGKNLKSQAEAAFIKREQYKDEDEYRVISHGVGATQSMQLRFNPRALKKIYLDVDLDDGCVENRKALIAEWTSEKYCCSVQIEQNRVTDNHKWQGNLVSALANQKF